MIRSAYLLFSPSGRRVNVAALRPSPRRGDALTLRPGQSGTRKLVERYGERLVRVRYLYDEANGRRLKTVELIVESAPWRPRPRHQRRRDDEIVAVRIAIHPWIHTGICRHPPVDVCMYL